MLKPCCLSQPCWLYPLPCDTAPSFPAQIAEGPPGHETTATVIPLVILAVFPVSCYCPARDFTKVPADMGSESIEANMGNRVGFKGYMCEGNK